MGNGGFIGHDLERVLRGDYYYQVCVSRRWLRLRQRWLPWTLRYETRYQPPRPPGGLRVTEFPLWERLMQQGRPLNQEGDYAD